MKKYCLNTYTHTRIWYWNIYYKANIHDSFENYLKPYQLEIHCKCILVLQEMDTVTRVQILDEIDCISHSTNTLGKGMNPISLPPAMGQ